MTNEDFAKFRQIMETVKLADLSENAQQQWNENDTDDYRTRIKCCYNCSRWNVDHTLMGEYAYNVCMANYVPDEGITNTKFDSWCPDYEGKMDEPNMAFEELWGMVE